MQLNENTFLNDCNLFCENLSILITQYVSTFFARGIERRIARVEERNEGSRSDSPTLCAAIMSAQGRAQRKFILRN
jgi:hypothetical protein